MGPVDISKLFCRRRFPKGIALVPILVYFPIGLVLAILRVFISFTAVIAAFLLRSLPALQRVVLRVLLSVLGIVVTSDCTNKISSQVLVTNHITILDEIAISLVVHCVKPWRNSISNTTSWLLGYTDFKYETGKQAFLENLKKYVAGKELPVLCVPEGAITSGQTALLKFADWPFLLEEDVQPIAITASRPAIFNVTLSTLDSSWTSDLFWFLFVPYTHFHIKSLKVVEKGEDESTDQYIQRVQGVLAEQLNISTTQYTAADKSQLIKKLYLEEQQRHRDAEIRLRRSQTRSPSPYSPATRSHIELLADRVKEVLPHVPTAVIKKDLGVTRDVDATITNILEGKIEFTPEDLNPVKKDTIEKVPSKSLLNQKKQTFSKNSKERQKSFEERKQEMIEAARQRYMAKHGMM
ncbi:unnamed protein product [Owenia fusiformis]|uniref:Lipid droplet-regulating VLDL assembly factor AUP1 n=1 Tax=Owenia fusiformis TaxID=6347 RepID=A0A8J1T7Z9_OWEFU|nr:unnamed protein product [Owenia fusiformis]